MVESIEITGLREVQKKLYSYSQQLGDRVVLNALRSGAGVIRKAIQNQVPIKTGKLKRGFLIARSKIHRGRTSTEMIGVYLSLRKGKNAAFYGRFQNDGYTSRGGKYIPGKQFVQNSFSANKESAVRVIISNANAGAEVLSRRVGL